MWVMVKHVIEKKIVILSMNILIQMKNFVFLSVLVIIYIIIMIQSFVYLDVVQVENTMQNINMFAILHA